MATETATAVHSILSADFGSVNTRVVLFDVVDGQYRLLSRAQTLTTASLPIVLLSSVSASAVAETYARSAPDRITGPLVGLRDAIIYQDARPQTATANAATMNARWQSVNVGALMASVVILFGMALNLIRSLRRRRS